MPDYYTREEQEIIDTLREHRGEMNMWRCVNIVAQKARAEGRHYATTRCKARSVIFGIVRRMMNEDRLVRVRGTAKENELVFHPNIRHLVLHHIHE